MGCAVTSPSGLTGLLAVHFLVNPLSLSLAPGVVSFLRERPLIDGMEKKLSFTVFVWVALNSDKCWEGVTLSALNKVRVHPLAVCQSQEVASFIFIAGCLSGLDWKKLSLS